jgi:hypothetical protein
MSSALREILARFGVEFDSKELDKGHSKVESAIGKLKELGEVAIGAFATEKVIEFGKELLESAEQAKVTAIALGLTTDEIQGLDHAATQSGVGVDELHSALARLQREAAGAGGKGAAGAGTAFKKLGVDLKDSQGHARTTGEVFTDVAAKIADIKNPTERAGVASQVFGRSYARLLPLLLKGGDGIKELTGEVEELGFGMDDAFIENSEDILHNLDRLKKGLKGIVIQALGPMLPELVEITEEGIKFTKWLVASLKNSEAFKAALIALTGRGVFALSGKLGGLSGILRVLGGAVFKTIIPFLLLEDVLTFLAGGKSVTGDLLERFFGKGTSAKVRKFVDDVKSSVDWLFGEIGGDPKRFLDSMDIAFNGLRNGTFWKFIFGDGALSDWSQFWTDLLIAPGDFAHKLSAALKRLLTGQGFDADTGAPKTQADVDRTQDPDQKNADSFLNSIPGLAALRNRIGPAPAIDEEYRRKNGLPQLPTPNAPVQGGPTSWLDSIPFLKNLKDQKGPGADIDKQYRDALNNAGPVGAPAAVATAPVSKVTTTVNTTNKITNNVTVPPGTPEDLAHDVAEATGHATQQTVDLRSARAALVPQAG